jgi:outer membrane protein assembly factor BamD (BamD/ComL family)
MHNRAFNLIIFAVFIFHILGIQTWAEETDVKRLFGFAESLFEEEDYYRAIGEYKRFIFLYPGDALAAKGAKRIAEAYYKAKRWQESIVACDRFLSDFPHSPLYFEVLYMKSQAERKDKRYDDALRTLEIIIAAQIPSYTDKALYQKAFVMLDMADWQSARNAFLQVPKESPLFPSASSIADSLIERDRLPKKSPGVAGILAALLPGAGHLYVERPQDALVALLLNSAFIWGAIELFQHDNYMAGGVLTFFEFGWYSGNIYSAVSSAHKHNRGKEEEFLRDLKGRFSISFYYNHIGPGILLCKRF